MTPSVPPDTVASPPPGRARFIVSLFIVSWLLWQVALPLSYYLTDYLTDQVQEEQRFSWRMFSQVWFLQRACNVLTFDLVAPSSARDTPSVRRLNLRQTLQPIWIEQLRENRRPVVEKFLRSRCERDPSVIGTEFVRTCPVAPGSRLPEVNVRLSCRAVAAASPRSP